ncbi:sensor histidine kinase [Paenibacillus caseinilyticus]|uniref:Histidine kinase n=1 Tax=Paenibacillus mucilaginosus K02 TaxID=997761 RepID=I0BKS2_9BACL|nr:sensor histidine kinase [Paenibacillus mucilaginosus]AFH62969.1 histidine kinase [Paenibacillus mucilaginosus K02]
MGKQFARRVNRSFPDVFYSLSFKHRILISFIILITLAITAAGTISYLIAAKEIQTNAFESSQETVTKSAQMVDEKLSHISVSVRSLMLSDAFQQMMQDVRNVDISGYFMHLTALQPVFSQMTYNDPLIQNILIATPIGDFYPTTDYRVQGFSFYESDMYYRIKESPNGVWVSGHADPFFTGHQRVLSLVVSGTQAVVSDKPLNVYVVVNLKEKELARLVSPTPSKKDRSYFFIDAAGEEIVQSGGSTGLRVPKDPSFLGRVTEGMQGSFFHGVHQTDYLVNYQKLSKVPDWILIGMQSKDRLLEQLNGIQQTTVYVILGFVLTSWLLSNRLTALLLRPLYKLQGLMRKVEGNQLSVRYETKYKDEVAQVGAQFNRMLDEINRLIEDVRRSEEGKRKAEMKALTAQMEPHFLYNTLHTIYCKSLLGENQDVNEMILALSQMFQLGLSGGRDLIPLGDELGHVSQYCAIQQKCYEGLFEYSAAVEDEELLDHLIPKILLQPLVENSILHGFKDRTSGGTIHIRVRREHKLLRLTIEDNGKGMDPENVLAGEQASVDPNKGYALKNIRNRLQLYYGSEAGMELRSKPEQGSVIELWIPQTEGEAGAYGREPQ